MSEINKKKVFFAKVSKEMQTYKENLVKELEQSGCIIQEASNIEQDIEHIREIIEQCEISIHLLSDQDRSINSVGKGFEETQIHYAVQHFLGQKLISDRAENEFKIYAWHPKLSTENIYEEEKISAHLKKIQQLDEVELLRTNFEEFKYYLLKKIEVNSKETVDEFYIKGSNNLCIYFIYDVVDKEKADQYIDYLGKRGFTVFSPIFSGDITAVRQAHNNFLKKFDIAIIFGIDAAMSWVNMKIMDILKSPGLGREKKILGKGVFIPEQKEKMLTLIGRGFDFFPVDQNILKDQFEEFLRKIDYSTVKNP